MAENSLNIAIDPNLLVDAQGKAVPGFKAFFEAQNQLGNQLYIIAAMSNTAAEGVLAALDGQGFMKSQDEGGYGFSMRHIFFPRAEAVLADFMGRANITHAISGSTDFLAHPGFPGHAQALLVGSQVEGIASFADWGALVNFFNWSAGLAGAGPLKSITTIKEGGDNDVYLLDTVNGGQFVLKHHVSPDNQESLEREVSHLRAMREVGLNQVPGPVWNEGNWAIFKYISGGAASGSDDELKQLSAFLTALDSKGDALRKKNLPLAGDARLSLDSYVEAVNKLWKTVFSAAQAGHQQVMFFMMTDLEQLRQDNINHFYLWCKREKWDRSEELAHDELIFSPVDFGLHNSRLDDSGTLHFLDMEQSGWDDPSKLLADFFYNIEQELDQKHKITIIDNFFKTRKSGEKMQQRFWAVSDIVAVEWILRVLYVVVPEERDRLQSMNANLDYKQLVSDRLDEAQKMRESYQPMEHWFKHDQLLDIDAEIK